MTNKGTIEAIKFLFSIIWKIVRRNEEFTSDEYDKLANPEFYFNFKSNYNNEDDLK